MSCYIKFYILLISLIPQKKEQKSNSLSMPFINSLQIPKHHLVLPILEVFRHLDLRVWISHLCDVALNHVCQVPHIQSLCLHQLCHNKLTLVEFSLFLGHITIPWKRREVLLWCTSTPRTWLAQYLRTQGKEWLKVDQMNEPSPDIVWRSH